jgi:hypothetical protein
LSRIPIRHELHALHRTVRFKERAERGFRRRKVEVAYIYLFRICLPHRISVVG